MRGGWLKFQNLENCCGPFNCKKCVLGNSQHKDKHEQELKLRNMTTAVCPLRCGLPDDAYQIVQVRPMKSAWGRKNEGLLGCKKMESKGRNERRRRKGEKDERGRKNKDTGGAWEPPKITNPCCYSNQAGRTIIFVKPARGIKEKGRRIGKCGGTPRSTITATQTLKNHCSLFPRCRFEMLSYNTIAAKVW